MLTIRGYMTGSPRAVAAEFRRGLRDELAAVAVQWHRQFMPQHFRAGAEGKYGMKPRSARYTIRKARKFGHRNPLEFTGMLKAMVRQQVRVTGSSKRARLTMNGPRYLYAYRKDYGQADKAAELTATTAEEWAELGRFLEQRMDVHIRRANAIREPMEQKT